MLHLPPGQRLDANETAFFNRQLEFIEPRIYRVDYPELMATRMFPTSSEAGPGAALITYRQLDKVGKAQIIAARGKDLPRVDIKATEYSQRVKHVGAAYGWTYFELIEAARAGMALTAERGMVVREAIETTRDEIAFFGDADNGLPGLFSVSQIPDADVDADGTGSSTLWINKDATKILRDMNDLAQSVFDVTEGTAAPNTLVMPSAQYGLIASMPRSSTSDTTVLEYFLRTNPYIKRVEWCNRMKAVPQFSSVDVMVAYKKDPTVLELHHPVGFTQLDVDRQGFEYQVPCYGDTAGLIVRKPLAISIGKGI